MHKIILLVSHLGSNSQVLCGILNGAKRIHWIPKHFILDHPVAMDKLSSIEHKYSNSIGLYLTEILYNYQISHKRIYDMCQFVYLARNPRELIFTDSWTRNYYIFRLRRIFEMARETGGVFLRWEDVLKGTGLRLLEDKLSLERLHYTPEDCPSAKVPKDIERAYELFIYRMNKLKLTTPDRD